MRSKKRKYNLKEYIVILTVIALLVSSVVVVNAEEIGSNDGSYPATGGIEENINETAGEDDYQAGIDQEYPENAAPETEDIADSGSKEETSDIETVGEDENNTDVNEGTEAETETAEAVTDPAELPENPAEEETTDAAETADNDDAADVKDGNKESVKPESSDKEKVPADKKKKENKKDPAKATEKNDNEEKTEEVAVKLETASEKAAGAVQNTVKKTVDSVVVRLNAIDFDNSTTLKDGEYTINNEDFSWTGGTGKANLSLDKVVVENGKATGFFTASSDRMSHVYYLGHTSSENDDPAYYDPSTYTCGEGVLSINNRNVSFPVKLNEECKVACRTIAMSVPHWVQYEYKITIDEGSKQDEEPETELLKITFKVTNSETGSVVNNAAIEITDAKGNAVAAESGFVYQLEKGASYKVKASADKYEETLLDAYKPSEEETVEIKLDPEEVLPEGTIIFSEDDKDPSKTNLYNTTGMFKIIRAVLVNDNGSRKLTVTLSGQGYHNLFKGTYEEALNNGLNKKNWIQGTQNKSGKWEFVIPVGEKETFIPIVAISDSHLKKVEKGEEELSDAIFARQIVLDTKNVTLTAGDYDAVVDIKVESKTDKFKAAVKGTMEVVGGPNSNNYACIPVITMKDGLYSKAFIGTAANAVKSGAKTIGRVKDTFTFNLQNTFGANGRVKMFEDKKPVAVAFYDTQKKAWTDYKLTIDKAASKVTIEALKEDEAPPEAPTQENKDNNYSDDSNKGTSAVDNATTLADGTYSPSAFRYSGGTGKVVISCSKIEVINGQAYAELHFGKAGGGEASVDSLRAAGGTYSGFNTFTIPVKLNANNTIVARTTAMSQPHWVEYTIYIVLDEPGKKSSGSDVSEKTSDLDEKAPDIIGLTASGETETAYSDLVKIFNYEDGYYLIEVDAVKDTARDTLEVRTDMALQKIKEEAAQKENENASEESAETKNETANAESVAGDPGEQADGADDELVDEEGGTVQESISQKIAKLYENEIIKYLVIPDGKEVPAGLDKEVIVIKQPSDKTYISSEDALKVINDLGVISNINLIGFEKTDIKDASLADALRTGAGLDLESAYGGSFDKWDLKTFIKLETNLAIESSGILPREEKTFDEDMENLVRLGQRSAQLEMAMFIDRSSDELNDLAKAEWYKVYGVIFNAQDKAEQLYKAVIDKATDKDKKDAEELLKKRSDEKDKMKKEAESAAKKQASDEK